MGTTDLDQRIEDNRNRQADLLSYLRSSPELVLAANRGKPEHAAKYGRELMDALEALIECEYRLEEQRFELRRQAWGQDE